MIDWWADQLDWLSDWDWDWSLGWLFIYSAPFFILHGVLFARLFLS